MSGAYELPGSPLAIGWGVHKRGGALVGVGLSGGQLGYEPAATAAPSSGGALDEAV